MAGTGPVAVLCVPLKIADEVVGALSVERPRAVAESLEKDLQLLRIVGSTVAQVIKINRLISLDKEEILTANEELLRNLRSRYRLDRVVGQSEAIRSVLATAATAAQSRASILISGETGTGKELIASVIHYNSPRAAGPFIKVNCSALPENLLESELFGHVKGAFTGAVASRKGRFELADSGTLFLDEVADMSPRLQVKLLRVLQEKEFEPVGGMQTMRVDVRVVAAANQDLQQLVREGRLRQDLYYRLNVVPIRLPSLRERREDIPLLVSHFLEKYNQENAKAVSRVSAEIIDRLLKYPWSGNIRELENCIERAVVMSPGTALLAQVLPEEVVSYVASAPCADAEKPDAQDAEIRLAAERLYEDLNDLAYTREIGIRAVEETIIRRALSEHVTHRQLAQRLKMSRTTLRKKIREYGLEP